MKIIRIALLAMLGAMVLLAHDLLAIAIEALLETAKRDMLGFGMHVHYIGWAFAFALPFSIGVGTLWFNDWRRYLLHVALLVAVIAVSMNVWNQHPNRTLLFLVCCSSSLPLRWLIDRTFRHKTS